MKVYRIFLIVAVCFVFGSNESFAQCGPTGTEPCTTTPKKTTPKKTTPKKTTPKQTTKPTTKTTVSKQKTTPAKTTTKTNQTPRGMTFVSIPAGEFQMGSNNGANEKPVHTVRISKSFQMQTTEVTQAQWQAVMENNPSYFENCPNCPVEQVSWEDTQQFVAKLNAKNAGYTYRLPTEAEWEYAARAGTTGDYAGNLDLMAWYSANSGDETHKVATKPANAWGLYDMHGNVWEWVQDWEGNYPSGTVTDPTGPASGSDRVKRGGSYSYTAFVLRSAYRSGDTPSSSGTETGFRLVRN